MRKALPVAMPTSLTESPWGSAVPARPLIQHADAASQSPLDVVGAPFDPSRLLTQWQEEHGFSVADYLRKRSSPCDAEDLEQEVWLRAWRWLRAGRMLPQTPRSWLLAIARNIAIEFRRKSACDFRLKKWLEGSGDVRTIALPSRELDRRELIEAVAAAVELLEPALKDVVQRRYFKGRTLAELARVLRLTVNGVGKRQRRAFRRLLRNLEELGYDRPE